MTFLTNISVFIMAHRFPPPQRDVDFPFFGKSVVFLPPQSVSNLLKRQQERYFTYFRQPDFVSSIKHVYEGQKWIKHWAFDRLTYQRRYLWLSIVKNLHVTVHLRCRCLLLLPVVMHTMGHKQRGIWNWSFWCTAKKVLSISGYSTTHIDLTIACHLVISLDEQ